MSRSQPGADRQADDLRRAGHQVVVAPVIDVEQLETAPPHGPFHVVVFLSEHAVRLGLPDLASRSWFGAARVLAVGARTATVLESRGLQVERPRVPTSEGLLTLPGLARVRGQRVLLVSGRDGRTLLARTLAERGADVARHECYRRLVVQRLDPRVRDCDALIAASGEALQQVAQLWFRAGGRADVPVLVPSARVAGLGVELGLSNLHDCAGADSDAWLRGLAQLQSAGTSSAP